MRTKRMVWVLGAVAVVVIAAGTLLAVRAFGGEEPAEVALTSPSVSPTGTSQPTDGSAEGTWSIDTASGSLDDGTATSPATGSVRSSGRSERTPPSAAPGT